MPAPALQRRLNAWTFCVVGIALLPIAWIACSTFVSAAIFTCIDIGLAALILTTPPDAIRLPTPRSLRLITFLTAWLGAMTWVFAAHSALNALGGIGMTAAAWVMARFFARLGSTPWWSAVLLWHPAAFGPLAWPLWKGSVVALGMAAATVFIAELRRRLAAP